jgi:hypothetical protein
VKYPYHGLPHPENTAFPRSQNIEKKREHEFIRRSISNKTPQTINEKENLLGYHLGTVSSKSICHCRIMNINMIRFQLFWEMFIGLLKFTFCSCLTDIKLIDLIINHPCEIEI